MKKIIKKRIKIILPAVFVLFFSIFFYNLVFSEVSDNIFGYGWNAVWVDRDGGGANDQDLESEREGGMGWLSFNCTNGEGTCSGDGEHPDYGLNMILPSGVQDTGLEGEYDTVNDASITGWAWSPNYGWLKFGELSDFPTGGGTTPSNAKFNGTITFDENGEGQYEGTITGWARFCAPTANPDTCTDASGVFVSNDKNGGWDGWVSLSGDGYGVTVSPAQTNSILGNYAWGGDAGANSNFVGWISFEGGFIRNKNAGLSFTADPITTSHPDHFTTLSWTSIIPALQLRNCIAKSTNINEYEVEGWEDGETDPTTTPGSKSGVSVPYATTWYQISCEDDNNNDYTKRISVERGFPPPEPPTVDLSASCDSTDPTDDSCILNIGSNDINLYWSSSNANDCIATSNNEQSNWDNTPKNTNMSSPGEPHVISVSFQTPITLTLTCYNGNLSGSDTITINGINPIKKPKYNEN